MSGRARHSVKQSMLTAPAPRVSAPAEMEDVDVLLSGGVATMLRPATVTGSTLVRR